MIFDNFKLFFGYEGLIVAKNRNDKFLDLELIFLYEKKKFKILVFFGHNGQNK